MVFGVPLPSSLARAVFMACPFPACLSPYIADRQSGAMTPAQVAKLAPTQSDEPPATLYGSSGRFLAVLDRVSFLYCFNPLIMPPSPVGVLHPITPSPLVHDPPASASCRPSKTATLCLSVLSLASWPWASASWISVLAAQGTGSAFRLWRWKCLQSAHPPAFFSRTPVRHVILLFCVPALVLLGGSSIPSSSGQYCRLLACTLRMLDFPSHSLMHHGPMFVSFDLVLFRVYLDHCSWIAPAASRSLPLSDGFAHHSQRLNDT
ncbi:hypothetical protein BS47DRAFT_1391306 [Hydnum rufescens UP504]|uniref:Uncharacterized protein n=1 Tax=Hydnum rufescens UP504 TaxID=1448309 RepID=A0A9P6DUX3_9AGAM|nr:hypothetical protein BS47DRAFT_1391306 [Hydnum rufescens UP504]